jgi:hypothetical protein
MNRTRTVLTAAALTAAAVAATPALPATGADSVAASGVGNGITYTIPVNAGSGVAGQCTIVADRWTADYGPSHVYATATSPLGIWTRIRCTVEKNGTVYVDQEAFEYGPVAVIDEGDGTIPVAGITICAEVESQFTVDARPSARRCQTF